MTKLSNIQPVSTHTPTGFDPQFATAKPTEPVSADYAVKHAPNKGAAREMNYQECAQYSNEAVAVYIRKRVTTLNESIESVRAEGNSLLEWEALMMVMHELERVLVNIPNYIDPVRGNAGTKNR
jgi:hypothetical protein|tara:strand:+ start:420 stop:791 length:372 start_codon:yes stop_codon:yes gene_type:complete